MKYSKLTYYLLAILCTMATSCVTDGVMDECPINDKSQTELIAGGKVNFTLNIPTTSTRAIDGKTEGLDTERTINDIQIYTFVNGEFVEKINTIISGKNGDATRFVEGRLSETYTSGIDIDFVVMANTKSKGISSINMVKGNRKVDLYQQLVYNFNEPKKWSTDIPMWGEKAITPIKSGDYDLGELTLKRAIAKVNITVNDGNGLDNFKITKVNLHNYNTGGYCAPIASKGPSIPGSITQSGKILSITTSNLENENRIENQFYIPEHKNIGMTNEQKIYLTIEALVKGVTRPYTIEFSENNQDYDVLRNNIYVFNITSVTMDIDVKSTLEYEVKVWNEKTIDIPSFN